MKSKRLLIASLVVTVAMLFGSISSASALMFGVQYQGDPHFAKEGNEMVQVGRSGAKLFRLPFIPVNFNGSWDLWDTLAERAAVNGVTLMPVLGHAIPSSSAEKAAYADVVGKAVCRYGYGGSFWSKFEQTHPNFPTRPVVAWETANEPNLEGFSAASFGAFSSWIGETIQLASKQCGSRETEVVLGAIYSHTGNKYAEMKAYLQAAYSAGGGNGITGVGIHPYAVYENSLQGMTRLQAVEAQVNDYRALINALPGGSAKSLWITELGWPAAGENSVGPDGQAQLLRSSFQYLKANAASLNLAGVIWYNFRDAPLTNWARHCGLRAEDGSYRPAWTAYQDETGAPRWTPAVEPLEDNNAAGPRPVASGNGTVHTFWRTPSGGLERNSWSPFAGGKQVVMPGSLASAPHAYSNEAGAVEVFWRTPSNELGHAWKPAYSETWTSETIPAELDSDPHAILQDSGTVDVFWKTPADTLGHWWRVGDGPGSMATIATPVASDPIPVVQPSGAYDVFWRTPTDTLGHFWYVPGGAGNAAPIQATLASDPAVGVQPNGNIDVFWRTPSGNLGHFWYSAFAGGATEVIAASLASDPHLIKQRTGALAVFWKTPGKNLGYFTYVPGIGSSSGGIPAELASDPYPVFQRNGTYDVFWRTPSGNLGHHWNTPGGTGSSVPIAAQMSGPPHAVAQPNGLIDVFWRTTNGSLGHFSYSPATGGGTYASPASIAVAPAPTATTEPATTQSASAFLKAKVNPRGSNTTYYFEYGESASPYANKTTAKVAGGGSSPVVVSELVKGLKPGVTYHYRIVAENEGGSVFGQDSTLTPDGWYLKDLGGPADGEPEITSWGSGRLDAFIKKTDGALYHRAFTGGKWGAWQAISPTQLLLSSPAAVSWGLNRIDVVARVNQPGVGNNLGHWYYVNGNWGFDYLGGNFTSQPGISSWGVGRLDVFARGATTNKLFHKWWDQTAWSGWEDMGSTLESGPAAASWGYNRIDVVAKVGGAVKHWYWAGSGWLNDPMFGSPDTAPEISAGTSNRLDVYYGAGGTVQRKTWANGWSGWVNTGLATNSGVGAVSWGPGRHDVVALKPGDNTVQHWYWIGPDQS